MLCQTCKQDFAPEWVKRHRCFGTPVVSMETLSSYVSAEYDAHGCLLPTRNVKVLGYKGKYRRLPPYVERMIGESYVHRAMLMLKLGRPLTPGLDASHTCGDGYENGACINPDHLVEETRKENHARMSAQTRYTISRAGGLSSPTAFSKGHVPWNKRT